jgi:hypothetical protein
MALRLRRRWLASAATAVCVAALAQAAPAAASTTNKNFSFKAGNFFCGYFVNFEYCAVGQAITPINSATGDEYNIQVSFDRAVHVPGSNVANGASVQIGDANGYFGSGGPGPYTANASIQLTGFSGPATPHNSAQTNFNVGYFASADFGSGYGVPNSGFSFTGANATIDVLNPDPNPLLFVAVGIGAILPATPQVISGIQGGTPNAPVFLPPGLVGSISGTISGGTPSTDFYGFHWQGGLFQTTATVNGANPLATFSYELLPFGGGAPLQTVTLDSANGFSGLISQFLPNGSYTIGLATTSTYDPSYVLNFNTPLRGVPEPGTWAMMLVGLAGLGGAMRRSRRQAA